MFTYGMVLAHFGVAVSLAGMATESAFIKETLVASKMGETHSVGPYKITLKSIEPVGGPNWTALEAELVAQRGDGAPFTLRPQSRMFSNPPTETNEAAIATRLDGQLYLVLGKPDTDGRWQLRLWWKPFVTLIWLGGALIAIGGALSLLGRARRDSGQAMRKVYS
jgi:cytochrome c-type biogenesis protein CcmF